MRHNNHTYVLLPQQFENFISSRTQGTMRNGCPLIIETEFDIAFKKFIAVGSS